MRVNCGKTVDRSVIDDAFQKIDVPYITVSDDNRREYITKRTSLMCYVLKLIALVQEM